VKPKTGKDADADDNADGEKKDTENNGDKNEQEPKAFKTAPFSYDPIKEEALNILSDLVRECTKDVAHSSSRAPR
jgi:hypothetical protein